MNNRDDERGFHGQLEDSVAQRTSMAKDQTVQWK